MSEKKRQIIGLLAVVGIGIIISKIMPKILEILDMLIQGFFSIDLSLLM